MSIIVERRERERENKKPPQPRQTTDTAQLRQTTDTAHWQVSRSLIDKKKHWQAHRKFSTVNFENARTQLVKCAPLIRLADLQPDLSRSQRNCASMQVTWIGS